MDLTGGAPQQLRGRAAHAMVQAVGLLAAVGRGLQRGSLPAGELLEGVDGDAGGASSFVAEWILTDSSF